MKHKLSFLAAYTAAVIQAAQAAIECSGILYHIQSILSIARREKFKLSQLDRPHVAARELAYFFRNGALYVAQPCLQWYNVLFEYFRKLLL